MSNPLPLLYAVYKRKGSLFAYLLLTNDTPFTCIIYNFASLLTAVFKITKPERFLVYFTDIEYIC